MSILSDFLNRNKKPIEPDSVHSISFAKAEPPSIKEDKNKDYVAFGADNLFPQELIEYRNGCSLHNAIIRSKSLIIGGGGLEIEWLGTPNAKQEATFKRFYDHPFPAGGNLHDAVQTMAYHLTEQGNIALQLTRDAINPDVYSYMKVMDVSRVRSGKFNESGLVERYYWARDWKTAKRDEIRSFPAYRMGDKEKDPIEVMYINRKLTGMEYYGLPVYLAALPWVDINMQMGTFHKSNLDNGFNPSMVFKFYKKPESQEQERMIVKGLNAMLGGAKNAGKGVVLFSNGKEEAPDVEPVPSPSVDKQLLQLNEQIWQEILSGHCVTSPMLLGIATPGKLGYSTEMESAWKIYNSTVIKPDQTLIERTVNDVLMAMGLPVKIKIKELNPLL